MFLQYLYYSAGYKFLFSAYLSYPSPQPPSSSWVHPYLKTHNRSVNKIITMPGFEPMPIQPKRPSVKTFKAIQLGVLRLARQADKLQGAKHFFL